MIPPFLRVLALLLLLVAAPVAAQQNGPFRVDFKQLVLLGGGEQSVGEERVVVPGQELLRTQIGYASTARLVDPLTVTLADHPFVITPNMRLIGATPESDALQRFGASAKIFCGEGINGATLDKGRFDTRTFPCLVDSNADGKFDAAFLVGTKRSADRILLPVSPPALYRAEANMPLPASSAWITFEKGAPLQGPVLEIHVSMLGRTLPIRGVRLGTERKFFPIERSVQKETYPSTINYGTAAITLIGYDPQGRQLHVRIEKEFETQALAFEYIQKMIFIYR